jgi:glutamyl-tRNA synthetase/glutamyl-Q tRNA(Asp) synthetase
VASALFVWGIGRAVGAEIVLRVEDHDRARSRKEYERAILDDLRWLGFCPDRGMSDVDAPSEFRQSDHPFRYEDGLRSLSVATRVYACECSRRDVAASAPHGFREEPRYSGRCRAKGLPPTSGLGVRAVLPDMPMTFADAWSGLHEQNPARQCGDVLVCDRAGQWTYQFAVAVDDMIEGINLVIRGEDLLASTARQIALAGFLGRANPPIFLHHPLIVDGSGKKLGKRFSSEGIVKRRLAGDDPHAVLGEAAFLAGLTERNENLSIEELRYLFA